MTSPSARDPLLLVHGITDTPRTWDRLRPLLERRYDVLAPGLVGHRGGPPMPADVSDPLAAMADGLERALDAAGHERAHLVGNSLGGWLAFMLAARGRALSVVALSPGHGWESDEPPGRVRRRFLRAQRLAPYAAPRAETLARRPRLRRLALADVIAHPERVPPSTAVELIRGAAECAIFEPYAEQVSRPAYREGFDRLEVPVRIAWGTRDRTLPAKLCSGWFRSALPDAEWVELPDCGHLPQHDDPELIVRVVGEVTARAGAAAVT